MSADPPTAGEDDDEQGSIAAEHAAETERRSGQADGASASDTTQAKAEAAERRSGQASSTNDA